jgi:hypothetical protein
VAFDGWLAAAVVWWWVVCWVFFVCLAGFVLVGCFLLGLVLGFSWFFVESLILAQDERWRRA